MAECIAVEEVFDVNRRSCPGRVVKMSRGKSKRRKSCFAINLQMRLEDDIWICFWHKKMFWTLIVVERDRFIVVLIF